jgi:hypothetical protein
MRLLVTINPDGQRCGECRHLERVTTDAGWCGLFVCGIARQRSGAFERVTGCLNAERLATEPSNPPPEGTAAA